MKVLSAIFVLAAFAPSAYSADINNDAYFPMEQGTTWEYETLNKKEKETFVMKVTIDGTWKEKDQSGVIMVQRDKRGQMREFLLRNEKGIFIYKLGLKKSISPEVDTKFTPAVPRLAYPLKTGTTVAWKGRLKVAWVDKPIQFKQEVLGEEEVTVPAGTFKCIKVFYDQKRGEEKVEETAWYAEGVGQVKYDGGQYVKELKSFKKAASEK
jgi:hypothetical protein